MDAGADHGAIAAAGYGLSTGRIGGKTVTQMRELVPATSFRSHDPLELHFGLGDATRVDDITVRWPSGVVQRLGAQAVRRRITITEGADSG